MDEAELWNTSVEGYEHDPGSLDFFLDNVGAGMDLPGVSSDGHEVTGGYSESLLRASEQIEIDPVWDVPGPGYCRRNVENVPMHLLQGESEPIYTCQVCNSYFCICEDPLPSSSIGRITHSFDGHSFLGSTGSVTFEVVRPGYRTVEGVDIPCSIVDNVSYDPSTGFWLPQTRARPDQIQAATVSSAHTLRYQLDDLTFPASTTQDVQNLAPSIDNGLQSILGSADNIGTGVSSNWIADSQGTTLEESLDSRTPQRSLVTPQDLPGSENKAHHFSPNMNDNSIQALHSANQVSQENNAGRKRRSCLACRFGSRKRKCEGTPLCTRCVYRHGRLNASIDLPGIGLFEAMYLDLHEWQDSIRSLRYHVAVLSREGLRNSHRGKSPLLLRISVIDPLLVPVFEDAQPVTFNVLGTAEQPELLSKGEKGSLRQPAVCDAQFDMIARDQIWSKYIVNKKRGTYIEENKAFSLARQFCGYLAILHDLKDSQIMTMEYGDGLTVKLIASEIVYFLVFRMAMIHQSLASYAKFLVQAARIGNNLYIVLYALEIIYRRLRTHGHVSWNLSKDTVLHPLWNVLKHLNLRSDAFLTRLERSECILSATASEVDGHKIVGNPTLNFVRKNHPLPAALKIAFEREGYRCTAVKVNINAFDNGIKKAFLEILTEDCSANQDIAPRGRRYSEIKAAKLRTELKSLGKGKYPMPYAQSTSSIEEKRTRKGSEPESNSWKVPLNPKFSSQSILAEGGQPVGAYADVSVHNEAKNRPRKRERSDSHGGESQPSSLPAGKRKAIASRKGIH